MLARERLFARLDALRERPVVWVAAEPGAGKTTLLASYLEERKVPGVWYQVDSGDADPVSFFHHLDLAADALPKRRAIEPLPRMSAEHLADLPGFTRRYFRALYARLGTGAALVLDNLHEVAEGTPLHAVLALAFDEAPEGVAALVASRFEPPPAYMPLIARERMGFLEAGDVRLTLDEAEGIASSRADLDAVTVRRLHERSGGWAAGLTLLVERARRGDLADASQARGALQPVFAYFAEELLAKDFGAHWQTLMQLAFLPRTTAEMAQALSGDAHAGNVLEQLHRRNLFTQRRLGGSRATYEMHALLRAYLRHRAENVWPAAQVRGTMARAAALLEEGGDLEEAVQLLRELGDWPRIARIAVESAQDLIRKGRHGTLLNWIGMLPEPILEAHPRVLYWRGSATMQVGPRAARADLERAHAHFAREGDALGRLLAASGVVYTHYLEIAQLAELDPWIDELVAAVESGVPFPTPAIELHVQGALLFALSFRRMDADRLLACAARVLALLEEPRIGMREKVASAAILLFHDYHEAYIADAARLEALVRPMLDDPDVPPAAAALWWMQVGWCGNARGDPAAAQKGFETSARICAEHGLAIPVVDVYAHFGQALGAICVGDLARAEAHLDRAEVHWKTFRRVDVASTGLTRGLVASHRGAWEAARRFAQQHHEVAEEIGIPWQRFNAMLHCAFVAAEQGRGADALELAVKARRVAEGNAHARFLYQADLVDALTFLNDGDEAAMRARLAAGLAAGAHDQAKFFLRMQPRLLPRLFAVALQHGIETEVVRRDIAALRIPSPDPLLEAWPWPLAVRTLGRFEVLRDGQPLAFSRKAPRKTLLLLKAIVALGGAAVREQALLDALWPDEEGDAAAKSLGAAVLRLRSLLGDPLAVLQQAGTVSLDRERIWVDALAFEQGGALALYRGTFLAEDEGERWAVPMRERLRARFIHQVGDHGKRLEQGGHYGEAIEWYRRGLDADAIVEPFHQGLMRCHLRLDSRAEAMAAYRRLRQVLSVTLGLPPSAATERLRREIESGPPPVSQSVGEK